MLQILNSLKLFCYRIKVNEYNIDRLKTVFYTSRTYIIKKNKVITVHFNPFLYILHTICAMHRLST